MSRLILKEKRSSEFEHKSIGIIIPGIRMKKN
jgi:hypothetical protein